MGGDGGWDYKEMECCSTNGKHTQVKCLLKALIFGTCEKDIIMHSQMGFQLNQSHSLTVTGLKGGKKVQLEDRSQKKKIMFLHSKNKASRKGYKGEC